jgi:hypothetical protein
VQGRNGHSRATIQPAKRCAVLARDGHRCQVKGFRNPHFLEVHPMTPYSSTATFNDNHIFRGGGRRVYLEMYFQPPDVYLDLSDNYWGVTEADSIASHILDGNDDPAIHAFVNFQPFSAVPIGTEQKSWGGVKILYR